ncbi:MAG TPA: hypothetical protein VGT99_10070 [Gammaproteobacteria bacterium]|nr:hypothetical protein [Gammaproteobacteria bacterium]
MISGPLQGDIAGGVYRDKRDWFSIAVPFHSSEVISVNVQMQEAYPTSNVSFVGFNALDSPGEFYKVYMEDLFAANHPLPDMDRVADAALQIYAPQLISSRGAPLQLRMEKPWHAGSTDGLIRFYTQRTPTEALALDLMQGPGLAEDYTAYILMYVTAQNGKVAMLWAEWPEDCGVCAPIPPGLAPATAADAIDRALAQDARVKAFFDSFSYAAAASAYQ